MSLPGRQPEVQGSGDPMRDGLKALFGLVDSIKERVLGRTSEALNGLKKEVDENPDRSFVGLVWERAKAVFGRSEKKKNQESQNPLKTDEVQSKMHDAFDNTILVAPMKHLPVPKEAKKEKAPRKAKGADQRLKDTLDAPDKKDWLTWATEASRVFDVPVYLIFSIMDLESHLNPEARNKSGAAGMGQFMPKTALRASASMKEKYEVEGLEGMGPCNPKWDCFATAWYIRQNANALGFDPNKEDAGYWAYICHFQGAAGAKAFRDGGVYPGNMKNYTGKFNSTLGRVIESEADYRELIDKLATGVQKKSRSFKRVLEAHEAQAV